jgi:hypothetical protein
VHTFYILLNRLGGRQYNLGRITLVAPTPMKRRRVKILGQLLQFSAGSCMEISEYRSKT